MSKSHVVALMALTLERFKKIYELTETDERGTDCPLTLAEVQDLKFTLSQAEEHLQEANELLAEMKAQEKHGKSGQTFQEYPHDIALPHSESFVDF